MSSLGEAVNFVQNYNFECGQRLLRLALRIVVHRVTAAVVGGIARHGRRDVDGLGLCDFLDDLLHDVAIVVPDVGRVNFNVIRAVDRRDLNRLGVHLDHLVRHLTSTQTQTHLKVQNTLIQSSATPPSLNMSVCTFVRSTAEPKTSRRSEMIRVFFPAPDGP